MSKKGFKASGRMSVERFEKLFEQEFGVYCDILDAKGRIASGKDSLANLRPHDFEAPGKVNFSLSGNMLAENVQKKFRENFGLELQIYKLSKPDEKDTLASLRRGVLLGNAESVDGGANEKEATSETKESALLDKLKQDLSSNDEVDKHMKQMFDLIDVNSNGEIELKEFLKFKEIICGFMEKDYDEEEYANEYGNECNERGTIDYSHFKSENIKSELKDVAESDLEKIERSQWCDSMIQKFEGMLPILKDCYQNSDSETESESDSEDKELEEESSELADEKEGESFFIDNSGGTSEEFQFEHTFLFKDLNPEFEGIVLNQLHQHGEGLIGLSPDTVLPLIINEVREEDYTEEFIAALEGDDGGQKLGWTRIGASLMVLDREESGNENLPESADSLLKRLLAVLQVQSDEGLFTDYTYESLFEDDKIVKKHWIDCLALTFKAKKKLVISEPGEAGMDCINWPIFTFLKFVKETCSEEGVDFPGVYYMDQDKNIFRLEQLNEEESAFEGQYINGKHSWEENGENVYADTKWAYGR